MINNNIEQYKKAITNNPIKAFFISLDGSASFATGRTGKNSSSTALNVAITQAVSIILAAKNTGRAATASLWGTAHAIGLSFSSSMSPRLIDSIFSEMLHNNQTATGNFSDDFGHIAIFAKNKPQTNVIFITDGDIADIDPAQEALKLSDFMESNHGLNIDFIITNKNSSIESRFYSFLNHLSPGQQNRINTTFGSPDDISTILLKTVSRNEKASGDDNNADITTEISELRKEFANGLSRLDKIEEQIKPANDIASYPQLKHHMK